MFTFNNIRYKDILEIEDLLIPVNKVTCIVGESGSGKTTLLRLLNKMISPDEGEIFFHDTPLTNIPAVDLRRRVVMLSQVPVIFPGTIEDNLQAGLSFSEKPLAEEQKLREALLLVHLNKDLAGEADKLSGGEKQRLCLARMMLMEPEVMLLDEPSGALDEDTEELIINSLVNFARDHNKTLIMVTHSKNVARQYAQQIIEVRSGKIIRQEEVAGNAGRN
ncbi:ABC transporter ATP-binding protein [Dethiobacter alkaliphilus]|uniref:ABC transporter related protein n=1 Tax=Dethiobacter alkaliphilus AHT 1 TaxID=555088 RepID=C0GCK4_DETAL|nr:ABC transporter ATP-binding protein [Dethiobacter alkaliphilus]EEG78939.1 ABC transporter related protein [Dethiobacter alkaliphilus AHT 1]